MPREPVNSSFRPTEARPYRQSARAKAAVETRQRLLTAAETLFLERGFAGTTTKAIASAAGVSEKTVFLTFPGKAALLSELIRVRIRDGRDDQRAVDSDAWRAMLAAPSDQLFQRFAALVGEMLERTARILEVAEAAAVSDAELAARRELGQVASRATMRSVVDTLDARGQLRADLTATRGTDVLFALTAEAVYLRLVRDSGWTPAQYVTWLAETAATSVLAR